MSFCVYVFCAVMESVSTTLAPLLDPVVNNASSFHVSDMFPRGMTFVGIDMVLFSFVGIMAYRQFCKARADLRAPSGESAPISAAGGETRLIFMGMLALSNVSRAITLGIEAFTQTDKQLQKSVRTWVRDFLVSLPTLFFLTTYSVVVLFWAQVYYASVLVSFPLLKPIVVFINIAVYAIFAVISCLTLLLMAWGEFRQYLYFLLGVLFLFCAINFFYYGVKVAAQLSERNKQLSRKSRIIRRVVILTSSVPIVLFIKGIYCSAVGLGFSSGLPPSNFTRLSWDCLNFFVSELLPSVLMLSVFWPGTPRADAYEPPSSLLTSREETVQSLALTSPLLGGQPHAPLCDTPMSEPQHPHLREAQQRLEALRGAQKVPTPPRVLSQESPVDSNAEIASEQFVSRPWKVRAAHEHVV